LSPDSLSPDSLSPDSLSPDSLSPDSLSPDSLSPDSLSPGSVVVVLLVRTIVALLKSKTESEFVTIVTLPEENRYFINSKNDEYGPK
jgi:hypothetical protein